MTTSEVIEKYYHQLSKPKLIFLVWIHDKYPDGVQRSKINYPHMSKKKVMEKGLLKELEELGAIKTEGLGTKYSKVVPV